ncbi:MAG: hypothetical protein NT157_00725 [Candidatus Micrarchaeota archaeon]|nr:hypothetical protein [Candidatus Micrarchaeota archaeon]
MLVCLASSAASAGTVEPVSYWYDIAVGEDSITMVWNDVFGVQLSSYTFAFTNGLEIVSVRDGGREVWNYGLDAGPNNSVISFKPSSAGPTSVSITMTKRGLDKEYGKLRVATLCLPVRNGTRATFDFGSNTFLSAEPRDYAVFGNTVEFADFGCARMAWLGSEERGDYSTREVGRFFVIDKNRALENASAGADGLYPIIGEATGLEEPFAKWA